MDTTEKVILTSDLLEEIREIAIGDKINELNALSSILNLEETLKNSLQNATSHEQKCVSKTALYEFFNIVSLNYDLFFKANRGVRSYPAKFARESIMEYVEHLKSYNTL